MGPILQETRRKELGLPPLLLALEPDSDEIVIAQSFVDVINHRHFCTAGSVVFLLDHRVELSTG